MLFRSPLYIDIDHSKAELDFQNIQYSNIQYSSPHCVQVSFDLSLQFLRFQLSFKSFNVFSCLKRPSHWILSGCFLTTCWVFASRPTLSRISKIPGLWRRELVQEFWPLQVNNKNCFLGQGSISQKLEARHKTEIALPIYALRLRQTFFILSNFLRNVRYHRWHMSPCYVNSDKLFKILSNQYHNPERHSNLGPKSLSLLEFTTWRLRPLGAPRPVSTPNIWEAFYWSKTLVQGPKDRRRAQNSLWNRTQV